MSDAGRGTASAGDAGAGDGAALRSDERLARLLANGNAAALGELFDRHATLAYSLARCLCAEAGQAENVLQRVFLELWREPRRFDPRRGEFRRWVVAETHRFALDAVRADGTRDRATARADQDDRELAGGLVKRLPDEQRRAFTLAYYGGYTYAEIAALTQTSRAVVTARLYGATKRLRRLVPGALGTASLGCARAELAAAFALHAVEPADEDDLIAHFPDCPVCRQTVRDTERLMLRLAALENREPPIAKLRDELLAAVARTAQTPSADRVPPLAQVPWDSSPTSLADRSLWQPRRPTIAPRTTGTRPSSDRSSREKSARRRRAIILLATLAFAVIGGGAMLVASNQARPSVPEQASQAQHVMTDAKRRGVPHALLTAPNGAPVAVVTVEQGTQYVVPTGLLPTDTPATTYVLWGIGDGPPVALGAFGVARNNHGPRPVGSTSRVDAYPGYAISVERSRTALDSPTFMMIASGQVAN